MRLVHCSDLHLLSLKGWKLLDFANKRWIGGMNLLASRGRHHQAEIFEAMIEDLNAASFDHVAVAGDITNLALEEEFRYSRELFDRLALGPSQVSVIPGNHDAYIAEGARHYAEHFAPYFESDPEFRWDDDDPWPLVRRRGPLSIFGLSTSMQTPWFTCYGRVGDKQLARLRDSLADERLADTCRVVMIHHPPIGATSHSRIRGLRDRAEFAAVIEEVGAELILHGHEHEDLLASLTTPEGEVEVRGVQSGTYENGNDALDRRARYRIFEISTPGPGARPAVTSHWMRIWAPERGCFTDDPRTVSAAAS